MDGLLRKAGVRYSNGKITQQRSSSLVNIAQFLSWARKRSDIIVVQDDGEVETVNMQAVVVVRCCPLLTVNGNLENLVRLGLNEPEWAGVES
jgi:hypothetical protein